MKEERKTKTELIEELVRLKGRVARLEKKKTGRKVQKCLAKKDDPSVRPFYENLALGYQSLDEKGFILDVNQTLLDMLGYSWEEVIGRWFGDFISPGYRSQFEENFPLFKATGEIKDIEFEMVRKDGTRLFVAYDGTIQYDGQRNFKQTHCLMKSITKRKRLEETLLRSETRFKALVEFSSDHIFLLDPNGTYLVSNNRVDQFSLESGESLVGRNLRDVYPPEIAEFYQRQLEQVLKTGQSVDFEHPMPEADGQHYHLDTLYPIHRDGKVWAVGGICRDITDRKRAEDKIKNLAKFPSENPFPVLRLNRDGIVLFANEASQMLLQDWGCIVGDCAPKFWCDIVTESLASQSRKTIDIECGQQIHSFVVMPILDAGYVNLYGRDVTERRRAENQLRSTQDQLRALSAHLQSIREEERTMIARKIHDELGQALTVLKMDSSWLAKRFPENQKDLIEKTQSMSKLIDSTIQTVRRISTELRPGILDDLGLIAAIEWQTQDFQDRTGIKCVFDSPLEEVELDRNRSTAVFRIFQETLTNVVRHANATQVNINVREEEKNLLVEIEDNGKGITDEEVSDPKSLGLLGMRERAHIFRGELEIKGMPGKGTTVTVRIPLEK